MIDQLLNNRYRVEDELGRGSIGVVYRAYDTLLNRSVAIKVLSASGLRKTGKNRLLAEARAAARLNHPNIVSVYDAGEAMGTLFIVMEMVDGQTLRARPPDSLEATLGFACQICAALDHAHTCGIIHRDLKPENIVVTESQTAKLMDFGLARSVDAPDLTEKDILVGTLAYLAPELIQGQSASAQSDLYALGVVLYELAAGRLPFDSDTSMSMLSHHLHAPVVPPSTHKPEIPGWLDDLIVRLLSKQPQERPASAEKVLHILEQAFTPSAFPLYRSAPVPTNNLPAKLSQFIGREKELAQIKQRLAEQHLVTLVGSGGIGKTRLAVQAAGELLVDYPQGVWLVELASVTDPRLVPQAMAAVWNVREERDHPLPTTLADYLREKNLLIVLDSCEHVIDACVQLTSHLLQRCPGLHILATSREALDMEGEAVIRVPSLSLPPAGSTRQEVLEQSEAVQLFVTRAAVVLPGFELTDGNAAAIAEVCRRLDGVALAVELAAARVKALTVEQIATRLDDAFRLLTGGSRTALPRQQTLRATIDWSHALLSEAERTLFRRLAGFVGGWTLEAAEGVCAGEGIETYEVLDLLTQLGNKSLLMIEREADLEARYRLLETIRQYAQEKLLEAGEQEKNHVQHLSYYLKLAQDAELKLYSIQQLEGLAQLDMEQGNIQTALEWGLEGGLEAGLRLTGTLFWSWHLRGHWADGWAWLQKALAAAPNADRLLRAMLLSRAGYLALEAGDTPQVMPCCEEGIALCREIGDKDGLAFSLATLGTFLNAYQSNSARAMPLLEESLALYRETGNKWGARHVLGLLGEIAVLHNHFDQASVCFQESLALSQELGVPDGIAWALFCLGTLAFLQGEHKQAMMFFVESWPFSRAVKLRGPILMSLSYMETIALRQGEFGRAREFAEEFMAEIREIGLRAGWRVYPFNLNTSELEPLLALLVEDLTLAQKSGDKLIIVYVLFMIAKLIWTLGQLEKATYLYAAALSASTDFLPTSMPLERVDFDHRISGTLLQLDEATFQRAWAEGSAMTLEQAVAYALEGRPGGGEMPEEYMRKSEP